MPKSLLNSAISGGGARNNHAHVVNEIGRDIIGGLFKVGENIPSDAELESRFSVSRTVLREAMKTLSAKGLVIARARVGTRVTDQKNWNLFDRDILTWFFQCGVNQDFLDHLCAMRMAFEPAAAMLAAKNAEKDHIERLRFAVGGMRLAQSNEEFALADLDFHMTVLEASKNPFMLSVGNIVEAALANMFIMSSPAEDKLRQENVSDDHNLIVDAIQNHDSDAAKIGMHSVIQIGLAKISKT